MGLPFLFVGRIGKGSTLTFELMTLNCHLKGKGDGLGPRDPAGWGNSEGGILWGRYVPKRGSSGEWEMIVLHKIFIKGESSASKKD